MGTKITKITKWNCFVSFVFFVAPFVLAVLRAQTPAVPAAPALRCLETVEGVRWERWMGTGDATLDAWCASVGKPIMRSPPFVAPAEITELQVVTWNVHVGGGRAETFIQRLIGESASHGRGVVLLLEETYRAGTDVPESYPTDLDVPKSIRPRRPAPDVAALAERFDLFTAYVPSMRNGAATNASQREDRGNAVLSTEPLTDVTAIELPFGRQRRVAVEATVTPRGSRAKPVRVIVFHVDRGDRGVRQAEALAARVKAVSATRTMPLVVAGDSNSRKGLRDPAVASLSAQIHREDECGTGRTFRRAMRADVLFTARLDFMFSTLDDFGLTRTCQTLEDAMGSDHVPVAMTITY
jgi:endonuclease/exonuclease/phosphatase family metal-dependent hydrolase